MPTRTAKTRRSRRDAAGRSGRAPVLILGIESSCDETAAAVVDDGRHVRSSVVASQHELHRTYRGVVPEIASRAHLERILPAVHAAIEEAECELRDLEAIAAGVRPGLIGSLLVGTSAAKGLAWALERPFLGIDHVEAHLFAGMLESEPPAWPALGLVVSGGHTSLFSWSGDGTLMRLGRTIDDAAGEAFDKAASMIGLEHPGGPALERLAAAGDPSSCSLPRPMLGATSLDFSFSGLKTAFRNAVLAAAGQTDPSAEVRLAANGLASATKADLAASFQAAVVETIAIKCRRAIEQASTPFRSIVLGGGVVANAALRAALAAVAQDRQLELRLPPSAWCLDNAAMIAAAAHPRLVRGERDPLDLPAEPVSRWS
ncbi:MAG: hypothetical protein RLZZ565_658 [Planctomycetota bacterium]